MRYYRTGKINELQLHATAQIDVEDKILDNIFIKLKNNISHKKSCMRE